MPWLGRATAGVTVSLTTCGMIPMIAMTVDVGAGYTPKAFRSVQYRCQPRHRRLGARFGEAGAYRADALAQRRQGSGHDAGAG